MAKRNFDSEFCGSLPLNNVNLIQDYGYLIVTDRADMTIVQLSENAEDVLGNTPEQLINSQLSEFLHPSSYQAISELASAHASSRIPVTITFADNQTRSALLHLKPEYLIFEIEGRIHSNTRYLTSVLSEVQAAITAIEGAGSLQAVSEAAISELKKMSGFDGVLMYQFDKDWNGKVIAEEKTAKLESYLGQTFPASDIPKQARELYLKNPYRQIPKRDFQPVSLYPVVNPLTDGFLDLSDCNLRSVPSVHREYMKNMGINASMSIRVLKDGQLWGLISCHHIEPKYIDMEMCSIFELLSGIISSRISDILSRDANSISNALQQTRNNIIDRLYHKKSLGDALFNDSKTNLLNLLSLSGAVLCFDQERIISGDVPDSNFVEELLLWIDNKKLQGLFHTDHLSELLEESQVYKKQASGLLVIPIDPGNSEYLLCFRPEIEGTIDWGGNPNEAINFEADGKNYHPRNSFKLWKEKVDSFSAPWNAAELNAARDLAVFLARSRKSRQE